ncbi:hypothetical protein PHYNN_151 [Pantoea phage Phynn]|nr:hypothetical protein PHYNN_151 [Pantoea phage Phynn]
MSERKSYKIQASYIGKDVLDSARDSNQHVVEIWGTREGHVEVEFEYFREFEKHNFLTSIAATPSKLFYNVYEVV